MSGSYAEAGSHTRQNCSHAGFKGGERLSPSWAEEAEAGSGAGPGREEAARVSEKAWLRWCWWLRLRMVSIVALSSVVVEGGGGGGGC